MKLQSLLLAFILTVINIFTTSGQTHWVLNNPDIYISTSVIDSITFSNRNGQYFQNLWHDGNIIEQGAISENDTFTPEEMSSEYEYSLFEEDGIGGILTDGGLYAIFQQTTDSTGYMLTYGMAGNDSYSCMLFDSLGHVSGIKTSDDQVFIALYTPEELWLIDEDGSHIAEIPYEEFDEQPTTAARSKMNKTSYGFTESVTYQALKLGNTCFSYITNPGKAIIIDLSKYILEKIGTRNNIFWVDLIDSFTGVDPFAWIELLKTAEQLHCFGNTRLTAMDAIPYNYFTFSTPCMVEDFTNIRELLGKYADVVDYSYTLTMNVAEPLTINADKQSQSIPIEGSGIFNNFIFKLKELNATYECTPSLTLKATYNAEVLEINEENMRLAELGYPYEYSTSEKTFYIDCTITGGNNMFFTGAPSSIVERVNNIKNTSADVVCSFSEVPEGAQCYVYVHQKGSEMGALFSAVGGMNSQTIHATGLSMNTTYVASTYVTYNMETFYGSNSIEFTTSGPSCEVVFIGDEGITDRTAAVKCMVSGIEVSEQDVECGVIAETSGQYLKFPVLSEDGEQTVTLTGLKPSTTYQCYGYVKTDTYYREQTDHMSFTTKKIPVRIVSVNTTSAQYRPTDHPQPFSYKDVPYEFRYDVTTTVELTNDEDIDNWGYIYVDPYDSSKKSRISLMGAPNVYEDQRFAFYRNGDPTNHTVTLYPFVKYTYDDNYYYETPPIDYQLSYPETSSIELNGCSTPDVVTTEDVEYNGVTYDYCSSFIIDYDATGAYWITSVRADRTGGGWTTWDNNMPEPDTAKAADGSNRLTLNFYYNRKVLNGDYMLRLKGEDYEHGTECTSNNYIRLIHNGSTFTGCELVP